MPIDNAIDDPNEDDDVDPDARVLFEHVITELFS
jgi:hypothetical protein